VRKIRRTAKVRNMKKPKLEGSKIRCLHEPRFRRLELPEIMSLEFDDVTYTLKLMGMAYKIMSDFVCDEYKDRDLARDVLSICEQMLKAQRHALALPRQKDGVIGIKEFGVVESRVVETSKVQNKGECAMQIVDGR